MIKIVFSDIDGTFLTPDSKVSPVTAAAVKKLLGREIPLVLVSARMPEAIYPLTDAIGIKIPIISYSGALALTETGEELGSVTMAGADTARLLKVLAEEYSDAVVNYYAGHHWYVKDVTNARVQTEVCITSAQPQNASFGDRLAAGEVPHKILLMAEPELCERAERELSARFPMFHVVRSAAFLLEIMDASVSKASGIEVMLKHFGFRAEESLSFGDNYNDTEMLALTGRSVAMGNAPDDIKKLATDITASNAEDGLAKFLEQEIFASCEEGMLCPKCFGKVNLS
ncbi:MAG: Cof-type HAD-IIB family hydrolase [Selenomonadaceae bacterium]|nr:Cof-type HAD-IIB family hydrolase [Selenomonadaceae bacterium]